MSVIASEEFINSFSGINDLCIFADCCTAERKCNSRSITKRLTYFINDLRHTGKICFRINNLYTEALIKYFGGMAGETGFIKALLNIANGICTNSVTSSKEIGGINTA